MHVAAQRTLILALFFGNAVERSEQTSNDGKFPLLGTTRQNSALLTLQQLFIPDTHFDQSY